MTMRLQFGLRTLLLFTLLCALVAQHGDSVYIAVRKQVARVAETERDRNFREVLELMEGFPDHPPVMIGYPTPEQWAEITRLSETNRQHEREWSELEEASEQRPAVSRYPDG